MSRSKNHTEYMKEYRKLPHVIEYIKEYRKLPHVKAKYKAYYEEYYKRPEVIERLKAYNKRPDVIEKRKAYYKRPDVIEKRKVWRKRPDVRARLTSCSESWRTCKVLIEHAEDLADDPERMSTEFIFSQIEFVRRKNESNSD